MIIGKKQSESLWDEEYEQCFYPKKKCTQNNEITFDLDGSIGKYTLCIDIKPQEKSNFTIVYQNDVEIGSFAIPYTGNIDKFGRYQPIKSEYLKEDIEKAGEILRKYEDNTRKLKKIYTFEIPVVLSEENCHIKICVSQSCLNNSMKTYNSEGFYIDAIRLKKGIRVPQSFFNRKRPGKSLVDLWGWMSMTSFEHPGDKVTPYAEQVLRGIEEAYPWGANNFEFLPVNMDGIALDLSMEESWEGKQNYRQSKDFIWSSEKVRSIIHIAKEYGMLTEFFLYCLHGAGFIATDMNCQEKIYLFEKIVKNYSNCLEANEFEDLVDGIITEAWFPIEGPDYINGAWKWNPGFFHLVSNNDGSQYDLHNMGYTPATHAYSAHWPGFDTQHTGYDHSYPLIPYPKDFYEQEEGLLYTYMQGCGQTCHPRKKYPRITDIVLGITNRTVSPDWIIAQAHNYGLRNLWDKEDHLAMAICWEADEQTMCPKEARRYVYACSQDPVRLAACYSLEDTGAGGELELKRVTRKYHPWDQVRLRARSKYPAVSVVNGNRFLQMISLQNRDETILHCDLSESGTFYNNGAAVEVAFPFIITRFNDNRFLKKEIKIVESAGPVAVLTEESKMGSGFVQFTQKTRHQIFSEIPAVFTQIKRQIEPGQKAKIQTVVGMTSYSNCEIRGNIIHFRDKSNILPEAIFIVDGSIDAIEYIEKQGLIITSKLSIVHRLNIITFLKMGDFKNTSIENLRDIIANVYQTIDLTKSTAVTNQTSFPIPVIVKIETAANSPCFIKENDIWQHRGVALSEESIGSAFIKLFLNPGETGEIRPYGYLDGIRAGRGCQNVLGFSNISRDESKLKAKVWIDSNNPMLHAPVIECETSIKSVILNGADYRYFTERHLFLSQGEEESELEITFGHSCNPLLTMTYAKVQKCLYHENDQVLLIHIKNQAWVNQSNTAYKAVIDLNGKKIKHVENGTIVKVHGNKALLDLNLGDNYIYFH